MIIIRQRNQGSDEGITFSQQFLSFLTCPPGIVGGFIERVFRFVVEKCRLTAGLEPFPS